jgi:PAS domain S-box-containing protein
MKLHQLQQLIVNQSSEGVAIVREDRFLFVNEAILQMTGKTREELMAISLMEFVDPRDQPALIQYYDVTVKIKGLPGILEIRIAPTIRQGGWFSLRIAPIEWEKETALLVFVTDITAQKKMEDTLRQSEERYRTIFENADLALFESTPDGKVLRVNAAYARLFGFDSPEQVLAQMKDVANSIYMHIEKRKIFVKKALSTNDTVAVENEYRRKDGSEFLGLLKLRAVRDEQENFQYLFGFVEDITDRKKVEREFREVNVRLDQKAKERTIQIDEAFKELEAFSYSISHDLRAPLRAVEGYSQALYEDYYDLLEEKGREYIERIRSANQQSLEIIDDILKLTRITRSELTLDEVDLAMVAREIVRELELSQPERKVTWVIPERLMARADLNLVRILLRNLFSNAWKFTSKHPSAHIEFGVQMTENRKEYFVSDDGAGFDMRYADKLFIPFQRLHPESEFEGTGIGLAAAQRIVGRHGGRIWAKGDPEHGATFYFDLNESVNSSDPGN